MSYSGSTAETLACFEAATECSVVAAVVTSGGTLGSLAAKYDIPVVNVPDGMQPRAAVGVLFGALAGIAEALNVVTDAAAVVEQSANAAQGVIDLHTGAADPDGATPDVSDDPPALEMAREIGDATVVVYGSGPTTIVAQRWKAQINENGKLPAFANSYPELDHNEIVGWEGASAVGGRWALVELAPSNLSPQLRRRMDVTRELIEGDLVASLRLDAIAVSRAGAVFELLVWGDYVSVYLALLRSIDPSPVERIQSLKARLDGE
jgi:glucose/mannose-6-phosphate isomerase